MSRTAVSLSALLAVFFVTGGCSALTMLDLNGEWTVTNSSNTGDAVPGLVPGSMYTALMGKGRIGDPYYRKNDHAYRWISREDWTYSRTFTVTQELLSHSRVVLTCDGLDTVAKVIINNVIVGSSVNMFVRYTYDIKSALKIGNNSISVEFTSAVNYANMKFATHNYTIPPVSNPPEYHGDDHANMIRKMQCSFSWDWGPTFPTQGIWKDIYIQGYDTAVIRDVTTETQLDASFQWRLMVQVFTEVRPTATVSGSMEMKLAGTTVTRSLPVTLSYTNSTVTFDITIPKTQLIKSWWPNGYGNQSLYDVYVFFTDSLGGMSNKKVRIGFRTVELVQDYVSSNKSLGRSFYFKINNQPIFLKGSNWIPADSFPERATRDRVYNYLKSARDVHMNSLRVWGGGVYESDDFYALADELGIMIWQDFMFGCAMYPADADFLQTVAEEVTHQVRRLKHHPSIIVLSGNNENEKALVQSWYNTDIDFARYKADYIKLYVDTISNIVKKEDTSRPFVTSSPSNGIDTVAEGYVAKDPGSALYGDIHFYNYLVPYFDWTVYRVPRMASEYGLQSLPSYETLQPVYEESDMDYWGELSEWRQHHPFGNIEMMAETIMYMREPNSPDKTQKFKDQIYVTQINQAVGMKTETEHYRRCMSTIDSKGQGLTMGAMYWMLEDIWQAPTWASLEYGGKWKMLHYFAQHFFAPTLISPFLDGEFVDVFIVLDELRVSEVRDPVDYTLSFKPKHNPRPFRDFDLRSYRKDNSVRKDNSHGTTTDPATDLSGNLYIEMYSWDKMAALHSWTVPFTVNYTAESVFRRDVNAMLKEAGCIRRQNCFLSLHLGDPVNGPSSYLALSPFNIAQGLQKANVSITDVQAGSLPGQFSVTLTTNATAPFVWMEALGVRGRFSDNGFLLFNAQKNLTFYAWETVDIDKLRKSLSVKSLMDIYY